MLRHVSLLIFLISCGMPAFHTGLSTYPGFILLLFGWIGIPFGVVGWLANPLYLMAYLSGFGGRGWAALARYCGVLGLVLGLTVLVQTVRLPDGFNGERAATMDGGAVLWMEALAVQALASFLPGARGERAVRGTWCLARIAPVDTGTAAVKTFAQLPS